MTAPDPQWNLSTRWPVALLPVRVETRFVDGGPTGTELWLRVLPDVLHVDTHQPALTDDEVAWGKQYWIDVWRAGHVVADELAAWRRLCELAGAERAVWLARVMEPSPEGRPDQPVPPDQPCRPDFPPVSGGASPWEQAPQARSLPSQWEVTLWKEGVPPVYAQSTPVRRPLVVGPPPDLDLSRTGDDEPPVNDDSRWLVDFPAAVDAGMGLRIPLPPAMAQGIDRLLVFGVDTDPVAPGDDPAARGGRVLGELLDAHFHTHGLDFLAPGTPTNNTAGARSGFRSRDADRADRLRVRHGERVPTQQEADAPLTARTLGVPLTARLGDSLHATRGGTATTSPRALARAADPDRLDTSQAAGARHMNTATWAATWGYFLSDLLTGAVGEDAVRHGRRHFVDYVRAAGPAPTLRVAEQPYGVLPVMALDRWAGTDSRDAALVSFLRLLRDRVWRPSATEIDPTTGLPGVPRVGGPGDAREVLLRILAQGPLGERWQARSLLGMEYVTYLWRFLRLRLDDNWRERQAFEPNELLALLQLPWQPRLARAVFAEGAHPVGGSLVSPPDGSATDYLDWLGAAVRTWSELRDRPETDGTATPLLYRILRQSALAEYATGARRLQSTQAPLPADAYRDDELVDIIPDRTSWTLWRQLERTLPLPGGGSGTVGAYLRSAPATDPAAVELRAFQESARALRAYPAEELERMLAETLDLCAYRLDAWITSFATKRLHTMRADRPEGIHLGGYGWLENLRRQTGADTVSEPPPGEPGPLLEGAADAGYVHAPSVQQAVTAAVLRAGYRAHTGGGDNPLAVDLTSDRIRLAEWLLNGVRAGQPLTELLGYRFERQLQDHPRTLEQYLPRLRDIAPVQVTRVAAGTDPRETVAATTVVDGLELHRRWRGGLIDWTGDRALPDVGSADHAAVEKVLTSLGEAIDAVADALLAESVHHAAQGNPMRTGATLDAASRGDVPATELEFPRTPRTGLAVTHRIVLLANEWPLPPADWPVDAVSARAAAEPRLNALVANLLPPPATVCCQVEWAVAAGSPVTSEISLDALGRAPLDLLALATVDPAAQDGELAARILDAAAVAGPPPGATESRPDRVRPGRAVGWAAGTLSLEEFTEIAHRVRELVGSGRAVTAADLTVGGAEPGTTPVDTDLAARADTAAALLADLADDLTATDPDVLGPALETAAGIGVLGAYAGPSATAPALLARAQAALADVAARVAALGTLVIDRSAATADELREHDVARLRTVFGSDFQVLPRFTLDQPEPLATALAASTSLLDGDRHAADDWLADAAPVRTGAERLDTVRGYAEAVRAEPPLPLRVAQLPYHDGDRWHALTFTGDRPDGSGLSLVVDAPDTVDVAAPLAGLLVDEWVEVLPGDEETTGVAFHAETPAQAAPQAILLAVPADDSPQWNRAALERTLVETLDLAALRAVDAATLREVGQFLPALYFPLNVDGDTAATDFTRTVQAG